ncbi:hypothetical protein FPQ18DRAFT_81007 [Pyronema domesticum]|uniref:Similar to Uncharacterized membrane protein C365.16 acc. no. Q9Y7X4 n=1 Tax=Pyronema omphalodes (strain CBS 100304) TaxID=1076935 RepID=U4LXY7_PYROM|nr:hypothetical protein FPQ18DRAFT_81007 [Pyronema domesticum]CCX34673.1 Similar to Uncharacterized membrane protein C365.16; acc. no. Q9Y7X4 [Pyronema omphalodes CBS 100304]
MATPTEQPQLQATLANASANMDVTKVRGDQKIMQRLAADALSASSATLLIAPIICLIDRSIMENASGKTKSVLESAKNSLKTIITCPQNFFFSKPFALIYMTYFGTYLTANFIDTFASIRSGGDIKAVTAGSEKFIATSTANMGLGLIKDRSFARMFGSGSPRPVPLPSFILFSMRDAMTIGFSFNIPPLLTPYLPQNAIMKPESAAQFLAPTACQLLSTPLHLVGLDLYNRQKVGSFGDRLRFVGRNYVQSAAARMCRIIPAFGFGGVTNKEVRRWAMTEIEKRG